jgi:hypothetical protein
METGAYETRGVIVPQRGEYLFGRRSPQIVDDDVERPGRVFGGDAFGQVLAAQGDDIVGPDGA